MRGKAPKGDCFGGDITGTILPHHTAQNPACGDALRIPSGNGADAWNGLSFFCCALVYLEQSRPRFLSLPVGDEPVQIQWEWWCQLELTADLGLFFLRRPAVESWPQEHNSTRDPTVQSSGGFVARDASNPESFASGSVEGVQAE